jgi:hypothetical protein
MEVVHDRCCGLDIHKKLIVACAIVPRDSGQSHKQLRTFGTMSDDLQHLSDWLGEQIVTHVAMESSGSYWSRLHSTLLSWPCSWKTSLSRHGPWRQRFVLGRELAPHDLRRTFTKLARSGQAPLEQIQPAAGHQVDPDHSTLTRLRLHHAI